MLSGSDDGTILVWDIPHCVAMPDIGQMNQPCDPLLKLDKHNQPITGLVVGKGGVRARVFSTSLDHTFKICDLLSGNLLLSIQFDVALTGLAVDLSETRAFLPIENGRILCLSLFTSQQLSSIVHTKSIQSFDGHSSSVRHLNVSSDGLRLVSAGSSVKDRSIRIWDVLSRQCLNVINLKSEITEMVFLPYSIEDFDDSHCLSVKPLNRNLGISSFCSTFPKRKSTLEDFDRDFEEILLVNQANEAPRSSVSQNSSQTDNTSAVNRQLYDFLVDRVLNGNSGERSASNNSQSGGQNDGDDLIIVENSDEEAGAGPSNVKMARKNNLSKTKKVYQIQRRGNLTKMKPRQSRGKKRVLEATAILD